MTIDARISTSRSVSTLDAITPSTRRNDIQALRALAVGAVVIEHFWPERLTGGYLGVDVFFVISGFLITGHLVRDLSSTGRIHLRSFWMRRIRRLLPAALTVVTATALAGAVILPSTQWPQLARHMIASTFYFQNWALAAESSDYFARSVDTSPLMHLWSLSVEEQFYLVWPILLLAATAIIGRRLPIRVKVTLAIAAVGAVSIVLAATLTPSLPSAYYSTPLRAWEFAVGAACALLPRMSFSRRLSSLMMGVAALALIACMTRYSPGQGVPGIAAIPPVFATGAVIVFGARAVPQLDRVLGATPLRWLGASSYSIYLWHWPLLILATALVGAPPTLMMKALLLIATGLLAQLTRRFIEEHFMRARPSLRMTAGPRTHAPIAFILACASAICLLAVGGTAFVASQTATTARIASQCAGAAVLEHSDSCAAPHGRPSDDAVLRASVNLHVAGDRSGLYCIADRDTAAITRCSIGAQHSPSAMRLALVGDSHAGQWVDPLAEIAREHGWHVDLFLKSSCPMVDPNRPLKAVEFPDAASSCATWRSAVAESIERGAYDAVVTSAYASSYADPEGNPLQPSAFTSVWSDWLRSGTKVIAIADTPRYNLGLVPDCVAATRGDDPCTTPVGSALKPDALQEAAALERDSAFTWVDMNSVRCDSSVCHTVLGGLVTVGDRDHMTIDFARSLTPMLSERLTHID